MGGGERGGWEVGKGGVGGCGGGGGDSIHSSSISNRWKAFVVGKHENRLSMDSAIQW